MQRCPVARGEADALWASNTWALELAGPTPDTADQYGHLTVLIHAERYVVDPECHVIDPNDGELAGGINEDVL